MRLWQKIFLCTLLLTVCSVNLIIFLLLTNNYRQTIQQQKQVAFTQHISMINSIQNAINYEKLKISLLILDQEYVKNTVLEILSKNNNDAVSFWIYDQNQNQISSGDCPWSFQPLLQQAEQSDDYQTQLVRTDSKSHLLITSKVILNYETYYLSSAFDITNLEQSYQQQIRSTQWLSMLCSIFIAGVLMIFVQILLRPLQRINQGTKEIAQGNYQKRLSCKGSTEISELASNMNQMADSIQEKIDDLEQVAENRQQFIANLAHEMKTPLTSILGFADIIRIKKDLSEQERQEYAGIIVKETKRLSGLSGKLMELILVGQEKLQIQETELNQLLQEVVESFQPILQNHKIQIQQQLEGGRMQMEPELFRSMVYNILENAIKASPAGSTIWIFQNNLDNGEITISIKDQGMGISKEDLKKVTEPFYMVDKSRSRKAGGAGLGLALCEKIAQLHHGNIQIESQLGEGTTVTIHLERGKKN